MKKIISQVVMIGPFYFLIPLIAGVHLSLGLALMIGLLDVMSFLHAKIFWE